MQFFSIYDKKITKLSRKNRYRTVASSGAWPSCVDARRQYIVLVTAILLLLLLLLSCVGTRLVLPYPQSAQRLEVGARGQLYTRYRRSYYPAARFDLALPFLVTVQLLPGWTRPLFCQLHKCMSWPATGHELVPSNNVKR